MLMSGMKTLRDSVVPSFRLLSLIDLSTFLPVGLPPSSVSSQLSRLSGQGPPPFTGSSAEEDEKEYLRLRRLLTLTSSAGEHVEGKKRQEEDADGEKTLARCSLNSCPSKDARMLCARCKR